MDNHPALVRLNKAEQALAQAKDLSDIKKIIDIAEAARVYAKAAKVGTAAARHAEEIKLRAQRKAGEILARLKRGKKGGDVKSSKAKNQPRQVGAIDSEYRKALHDTEIAPRTADRWQQVAAVPESKFNAYLKETEEVTTSGLVKEWLSENRKARKVEAEEQALAAAPVDRPWIVTPDQSVIKCDAVITDPPYGILDQEWEPSDLESFTREWATRWAVCGADFMLIFWSQRHLWDGRKWFDESLQGYKFQQLLVWHYPNNKSPQSRAGFKQTWEPVYFYRKESSKKEIGVAGSSWGGDLNDFDCHVSAVPQSNFNGEDFKQHPAQKSASVMRWLVGATTQPGELVCDPFSGSGTTGLAAIQLNRRFHGIEISQEYRELAERRLAAHGQIVRAA